VRLALWFQIFERERAGLIFPRILLTSLHNYTLFLHVKNLDASLQIDPVFFNQFTKTDSQGVTPNHQRVMGILSE
jgi:hypothetical protein